MKIIQRIISSMIFITLFQTLCFATNYKIVVMPFDKLNKGANEELETLTIGISETLSGALSTVDNFIIIDSGRVKRHLLESMQFKQAVGVNDSSDMEKLRIVTKDKLDGDYIIYGNFYKIGKQIQLTAKFMNVSSGKVLKAASVNGSYPSDIFILQEKLAKKLTDTISGTSSNTKKNSIKDYTNSTDNYTAYQYYIKGRIEQTQYDVKNYPVAVSFYKRALKHDPKYALAWAGLSEVNALWGYQIKYANGEWGPYLKKAVSQGMKAVKYGENLYQTHRALSMAYLNNSNFKEAQIYIDRAYNLNQQDAETLQIKAQLKNYGYKKMAEVGTESNKYIKESLAINPELIIARWSLAHSYSTTGMKQDALNEYKEILKINPRHAPALHGIALIYYNFNDLTNAEQYALRTVEADPKTAQHHYTLSLAYYKQRKWDQAQSASENAIRLNPKYEKAIILTGQTYYNKKNYKKSVEILKKAISINPKNHKAYNEIAIAYYSLKDYKNAEKNSLMAVKYKPEDPINNYNLGLAYYQQKHWDQAIKAFRNTVKYNPRHISALYSIANSYWFQKKYDLAYKAYGRVLEVNPNHTEAKKWRNNAYNKMNK